MFQQFSDKYFVRGHAPRLKYITHQIGGENWIERPIHTHTETAEILIVKAGSANYNLNTTTYELHAGDIVLCNPGVPHEVQSLPRDLPDMYTFGFTNFQRPDLPLNHLFPEKTNPIRNSPEELSLLFSMCDYLFHTLSQDAEHAVFTSLLQSLLTIVLEAPEKVPEQDREDWETDQEDPEKVIALRAKEYIDLHYTEALTLEELAAALNYSAPYISHSFKKVMGYSPIQYQTRCRIGAAQNFLIETDYSATQIATMVGFNSTNYFTNTFTRMLGSTPIQYRKHYRSEINKNT
ncbi:MAG: helix-turn-helix domain-containing protein [Lachnospiraceae bacterium]|nr:helix-turn-helix domain-containing protein [Lachnospiraceae bacterium]